MKSSVSLSLDILPIPISTELWDRQFSPFDETQMIGESFVFPRADASVLEKLSIEAEHLVQALKSNGNTLFRDKTISPEDAALAAAGEYSKAVELCSFNQPLKSVLLSNRAQCRLNRREWKAALTDATTARALDPLNMKAILRIKQARSQLSAADIAGMQKEARLLQLQHGIQLPPNPVPEEGEYEWVRFMTESIKLEDERRVEWASGREVRSIGEMSIATPASQPGGSGRMRGDFYQMLLNVEFGSSGEKAPKDCMMDQAMRYAASRPNAKSSGH